MTPLGLTIRGAIFLHKNLRETYAGMKNPRKYGIFGE